MDTGDHDFHQVGVDLNPPCSHADCDPVDVTSKHGHGHRTILVFICYLCKPYKYVGNSATRYSARDARLLQDETVPCSNAKGRRKKDTKRWCKGIVGREHEYEVQELPWVPNARNARFADVCTKCGKRENEFWVWLVPKPEWLRRLESGKKVA